MKMRLSETRRLDKEEATPQKTARRYDWLMVLLAVGAFSLAMVHALFLSVEQDLRTPLVMGINLMVCFAIAVGFAVCQRSITEKVSYWGVLLFALWSVAVFREVPVISNDRALFFSGSANADVPYVLLFSAIRGLIVAFLISLFAARVMIPAGEHAIWRSFEVEEQTIELSLATMISLYIVAAVVRLIAG